MTNGSAVVFDSLELGPDERGEIILSPSEPLRNPVLFASVRGGDGQVEEIVHGRGSLCAGPWGIEAFKLGRPLPVTVTAEEPIKIVICNHGQERAMFGASLVANKE
jgi:hypothetical protein